MGRKPKPTLPKSASFNEFEKAINRSLDLLEIAGLNELRGRDTTDLIRMSVVLSVSAMDYYFTSRFSEDFLKLLKKKYSSNLPDNVVKLLTDSGLDVKQALEMTYMERPWRRVRKLIDKKLSSYTTQRFEVIDELFAIYGLPTLSKNAERKANRKKLIANINKLVSRRHNIAHNADLNSHDKLTSIESKIIKSQINNLRLLVQKCDDIINNVISNL